MFATRAAFVVAGFAFTAGAQIRCEDLSQYGVVLVPPSAPEYAGLLADIEQRIAHPVQGTPTYPPGHQPSIPDLDRELSAILVNRSGKTIASASMIWRAQRAQATFGLGAGPGVFDTPPEALTRAGYWHVILPGSTRYIGGGVMAGDNSGVRPPSPAEMGGTDLAGTASSLFGEPPPQDVTMTLDGVFFSDGEFVGPDQSKLWERTASSFEEHLRIGSLAKTGHDGGQTAEQIFADLATVTGPAEQRFPGGRGLGLLRSTATMQDFEQWTLAQLAWDISRWRKHDGDEATVWRLVKWAGVTPPLFRRE